MNPIGPAHSRRLRAIWRSAGWPCQDLVEVELLAAGLLERLRDAAGRETLRVTDAGLALIDATLQQNRAARSAHEALVERVAREMQRAGRIVWRGLCLRAPPHGDASTRWPTALPDVFSIRHTTSEDHVEPIVHEIKVRRADLLADLRHEAKRAAYLALSSQCWYVLQAGIGTPDEIPPEHGVLLAHGERAGGRAAGAEAPDAAAARGLDGAGARRRRATARRRRAALLLVVASPPAMRDRPSFDADAAAAAATAPAGGGRKPHHRAGGFQNNHIEFAPQDARRRAALAPGFAPPGLAAAAFGADAAASNPTWPSCTPTPRRRDDAAGGDLDRPCHGAGAARRPQRADRPDVLRSARRHSASPGRSATSRRASRSARCRTSTSCWSRTTTTTISTRPRSRRSRPARRAAAVRRAARPAGLARGRTACAHAVELDWWDQPRRVGDVDVVLVPAQHWSARGLNDRMKTLWGGFAVLAPDCHLFFAGDTGYSRDFVDIRERFAPRQTRGQAAASTSRCCRSAPTSRAGSWRRSTSTSTRR